MLGGSVKPDRLIVIPPAFRDVSRKQYRHSHEAMPNHERDWRPLLFGERQELRRKVAQRVAIECHKDRGTDAVEDREQQQRIFGRLSRRFGSLDQQTCLLRSCLGFGGRIAFDMDERGYERDLKLDLLAT